MFSSGADVIHPAPGSDGRPSFTALVGNVDSDTAKYVAGEIFIDFTKPKYLNRFRFTSADLKTRDD